MKTVWEGLLQDQKKSRGSWGFRISETLNCCMPHIKSRHFRLIFMKVMSSVWLKKDVLDLTTGGKGWLPVPVRSIWLIRGKSTMVLPCLKKDGNTGCFIWNRVNWTGSSTNAVTGKSPCRFLKKGWSGIGCFQKKSDPCTRILRTRSSPALKKNPAFTAWWFVLWWNMPFRNRFRNLPDRKRTGCRQ